MPLHFRAGHHPGPREHCWYQGVPLTWSGYVSREEIKISFAVTCFIAVSCQRVDVNVDAVGEDKLIFPQGKVMTLHQTLETGFEYEVGSQ